MELLADENVETEWIQALRDDGHDIVRVVDIDALGVSATDPDVLAVATREGRAKMPVVWWWRRDIYRFLDLDRFRAMLGSRRLSQL